jgi:hypothetical protein
VKIKDHRISEGRQLKGTRIEGGRKFAVRREVAKTIT